jgi:hypothetical protein
MLFDGYFNPGIGFFYFLRMHDDIFNDITSAIVRIAFNLTINH